MVGNCGIVDTYSCGNFGSIIGSDAQSTLGSGFEVTTCEACSLYSDPNLSEYADSVMIGFAAFYLLSIAFVRDENGSINCKCMLGYLIFTFLPTLDTISDIGYAMTSAFTYRIGPGGWNLPIIFIGLIIIPNMVALLYLVAQRKELLPCGPVCPSLFKKSKSRG